MKINEKHLESIAKSLIEISCKLDLIAVSDRKKIRQEEFNRLSEYFLSDDRYTAPYDGWKTQAVMLISGAILGYMLFQLGILW